MTSCPRAQRLRSARWGPAVPTRSYCCYSSPVPGRGPPRSVPLQLPLCHWQRRRTCPGHITRGDWWAGVGGSSRASRAAEGRGTAALVPDAARRAPGKDPGCAHRAALRAGTELRVSVGAGKSPPGFRSRASLPGLRGSSCHPVGMETAPPSTPTLQPLPGASLLPRPPSSRRRAPQFAAPGRARCAASAPGCVPSRVKAACCLDVLSPPFACGGFSLD